MIPMNRFSDGERAFTYQPIPIVDIVANIGDDYDDVVDYIVSDNPRIPLASSYRPTLLTKLEIQNSSDDDILSPTFPRDSTLNAWIVYEVIPENATTLKLVLDTGRDKGGIHTPGTPQLASDLVTDIYLHYDKRLVDTGDDDWQPKHIAMNRNILVRQSDDVEYDIVLPTATKAPDVFGSPFIIRIQLVSEGTDDTWYGIVIYPPSE